MSINGTPHLTVAATECLCLIDGRGPYERVPEGSASLTMVPRVHVHYEKGFLQPPGGNPGVRQQGGASAMGKGGRTRDREGSRTPPAKE